MTSSNGNIFRVTGPLCGEFTGHRWFLCMWESPVTREFYSQRPVKYSFDGFFDLRLNKQLSKQWRRRWFETPSRSLWRHCHVYSFVSQTMRIIWAFIRIYPFTRCCKMRVSYTLLNDWLVLLFVCGKLFWFTFVISSLIFMRSVRLLTNIISSFIFS